MRIDLKYTPEGMLHTPWGVYDVSSPEGIVVMGLAQLENIREGKETFKAPVSQGLLDDIAAYHWILENRLCDKYIEAKKKIKAFDLNQLYKIKDLSTVSARSVAKQIGWPGREKK